MCCDSFAIPFLRKETDSELGATSKHSDPMAVLQSGLKGIAKPGALQSRIGTYTYSLTPGVLVLTDDHCEHRQSQERSGV